MSKGPACSISAFPGKNRQTPEALRHSKEEILPSCRLNNKIKELGIHGNHGWKLPLKCARSSKSGPQFNRGYQASLQYRSHQLHQLRRRLRTFHQRKPQRHERTIHIRTYEHHQPRIQLSHPTTLHHYHRANPHHPPHTLCFLRTQWLLSPRSPLH